MEDGNWANPQAGRLVRKLPSHRQLGTKWPNGRGEAQVPAGRLALGRGHERKVGTQLAEALIWAVSDPPCTSALLLSKHSFSKDWARN